MRGSTGGLFRQNTSKRRARAETVVRVNESEVIFSGLGEIGATF